MNTTKKIIFTWTCATLFFSCGGNGKKDQKSNKPNQIIEIDAAIASPVSFNDKIEAAGNVLAAEFVELKPEMSGRVEYINITEGKFIKEGTLIMKIYDADLKAQLHKFNSQLEIAQKTEARLRSLLDAKGLNRQEYDLALNQVKVLESEVELINAQIRKTEIRAPFDGISGLRRISKGSFVTTQDIITTIQSDKIKIDFLLPESYSYLVNVGDEAELEGIDGNIEKVKITGIEPVLQTQTGNIKVRCVPVSSNSKLRPGSFVTVYVDAAKNKKAILVPANCVIPETRFKKIAVIRSNKVNMTNVETGYRGKGMIEIISGLNTGDTFALNGILYLKPGADVKIRSVKQQKSEK